MSEDRFSQNGDDLDDIDAWMARQNVQAALRPQADAFARRLWNPDWIMDSPFNVSKPRGLSQGDFYEYHYAVDPEFHGARLPRYLNDGKGWSGAKLGAERYSGAAQLWARTPQIWKDSAAGLMPGEALGWLPENDRGPQ